MTRIEPEKIVLQLTENGSPEWIRFRDVGYYPGDSDSDSDDDEDLPTQCKNGFSSLCFLIVLSALEAVADGRESRSKKDLDRLSTLWENVRSKKQIKWPIAIFGDDYQDLYFRRGTGKGQVEFSAIIDSVVERPANKEEMRLCSKEYPWLPLGKGELVKARRNWPVGWPRDWEQRKKAQSGDQQVGISIAVLRPGDSEWINISETSHPEQVWPISKFKLQIVTSFPTELLAYWMDSTHDVFPLYPDLDDRLRQLLAKARLEASGEGQRLLFPTEVNGVLKITTPPGTESCVVVTGREFSRSERQHVLKSLEACKEPRKESPPILHQSYSDYRRERQKGMSRLVRVEYRLDAELTAPWEAPFVDKLGNIGSSVHIMHIPNIAHPQS